MKERLQQLIDTNEFEFLKTMSEEDIWKFAFAILYIFSEREERTGHCNSCKWYDEDGIYNPNCENCCRSYNDNYCDAEMTLDEAIKHEEEAAEVHQKVVDTGIILEEHLADYQRYADEHRQTAEWLKELKEAIK